MLVFSKILILSHPNPQIYSYSLNEPLVEINFDIGKDISSKRSHKILGELIGFITVHQQKNQYEFYFFNSRRAQWVKYKDIKLHTFESFKDLDQSLFDKSIVLLYKDPK